LIEGLWGRAGNSQIEGCLESSGVSRSSNNIEIRAKSWIILEYTRERISGSWVIRASRYLAIVSNTVDCVVDVCSIFQGEWCKWEVKVSCELASRINGWLAEREF